MFGDSVEYTEDEFIVFHDLQELRAVIVRRREVPSLPHGCK